MIADAQKDDPKFRRCLCPNCNFGQVHESGELEPVMRCGLCDYKMCYIHSTPWHEGQTCAEYDAIRWSKQRSLDEQASQITITRISKECPGPGCGRRIEKIEGCDHITCKSSHDIVGTKTQAAICAPIGTQCGHEFCWQCLAAYRPIRRDGNTGHLEECPYHSDNLPSNALFYPHIYLHGT